jgi:hypothetical protein
MKKFTQRVNSSSPLQKSHLSQPTPEKSLRPEESRGATAVSAPAMGKSDLQSIIDRFSQSSPPRSTDFFARTMNASSTKFTERP